MNTKVWIIETGDCPEDRTIEGIVLGPPDAPMRALRQEHAALLGTMTYRQLGYRAWRRRDEKTGEVHEHIYNPGDWRLYIASFPERPQDEYPSSPLLDDVPSAEDWRLFFTDWLIEARGFTRVAWACFNPSLPGED